MRNSRNKLKPILIHLPVGMFCVFLAYVHWVLALIFGLGFLSYETIQEWRMKDKGWKDIKGFLWGLGVGGLIWVILHEV